MKKPFLIVPFVLSVCLIACSCSGNALSAYTTFSAFGCQTTWAFSPHAENRDKEIWQSIFDLAEEVENSVSLSKEESAVSRFNRASAGAVVELDQTAFEILKIAQKIYNQTDGAYNPATGIYIDLWGFSPRCCRADYKPREAYDRADYTGELPAQKYIEAFRALTDFSCAELYEAEGGYFLKKPSAVAEADGVIYTMQLNLGGIAKGYCADKAEKLVRAAGYDTGYLSLGASSLVVLSDPTENAVGNGRWRVGINSPRGVLGDRFMEIYFKDCSLSSSGDGEQFYELDGRRYCHIIDPFTGYPINAASGSGLIAATLVGCSGAEGDALTTALLVMGRERALSFAREHLGGCGLVLTECDGAGAYTVYTNLQEGDFRLLSEGVKAVPF